MVYAGLNLGAALIVFAFSRSYLLSIGMMVLIGMGQAGHIVMGNILIQSYSDKEYVGRVMSVLLMCGAASNLILVVSICLLFLPWIRKIE